MLLEVARRLSHRVSNLKVMILCAPSFEKEELMPYLENFKVNFVMMKTDPFKMIALTDMILGSSGTATLMVGLVEKPMVTMYKMKWLSGVLAKYMVKGIKFFNLCNMILDEEVSPERFQEKATVDELERLVFELISNPEVYANQKRKLTEIKTRLGEQGVTERVVRILNTYLESNG
jgi:lipid-A-disaccharide synthase